MPARSETAAATDPDPAVDTSDPKSPGSFVRTRWRSVARALAVALVAVVLPYVVINTPSVSVFGNVIPFNIDNLSYAMVASVAVLSLVVLVGWNGQLSLAAGFFVGVGAYVAIIVNTELGVPFVLGVVIASLVCGALGLLVGLPALRIRGTYLALVTITLAAVFPSLVRLPSIKQWTGGSDGLPLPSRPEAPAWLPVARAPEVLGHIPGIGPYLIGDRPLGAAQAGAVWVYFVVLAATVAMFWLVAGIGRGRIGRAILAVRDHEIGAAASGVNTARLKVMVFAVSAAVAGVAGGMYAAVFRIVAPETFGLTLAIYLLFGMILGGHRSMAGAVIGGFAVAYLPAITGQITHLPGVPDRYLNGPTASLTLGALLVLFPLLMPGGVADARMRGRRRKAGRREVDSDGSPPDPRSTAESSASHPDERTSRSHLAGGNVLSS
jgi:branched-chain amino acid transport system permease protein